MPDEKHAHASKLSVYQREDLRSAPLYVMTLDENGKTIRVIMQGLWKLENVDPYMDELERLAASVRQTHQSVRVVVDVRGAPVWVKPVAIRLTERNRAFYRKGDRLALILHSSLTKVRARRHILDEYQNLFLSPSAAELWVSA